MIEPVIGIIMGSQSDLPIAKRAMEILKDFEIPFEIRVASAHRTPKLVVEYCKEAQDKSLQAIIAIAGASAALPGVVAAHTWIPVIGVPVCATTLGGLDALLSMAQMPGGVPVATMAIGESGAQNAAFFAIRLLALKNPSLQHKIQQWFLSQEQKTQLANQNIQ